MRRQRILMTVLAGVVALVLGGQNNASGPQGFESLAQAAEEARSSGDVTQAIRLYRQALEIQPDWPVGWFQTGVLFYDSGRYPEAIGAFSQLIEVTRGDPQAHALLGLSQYENGEYPQALDNLARAVAMGLPNAHRLTGLARIHAAQILARNSRFDEALQVLTEQARVTVDDPRLVQAFGIAILRLPYLPSELPDGFRERVHLAGRAAALAAADQKKPAREAFEQVIRRFPDTPHLHYSYGVFLSNDQPAEAIAHLRQELEVEPRHLAAMLKLALLLWTGEETEEARELTERALVIYPDSPGAHGLLGRILLDQQEVGAAIPHLEEAARLAPDNPEILLALQRGYSRADRNEDAERVRRQFLQVQQARAEEERPPGPR